MKDILYRKVLVLNKGWKPVGFCSVRTALGDFTSSITPKLGLKIEYYKDPSGNYHFDKPVHIEAIQPAEDWYKLEPREHDECGIRSPHAVYRVPTVIISPEYDKLPQKTFKPTRRNIYEWYGGVCVWCGEWHPYKDTNIEHLISRYEWAKRNLPGSPHTWYNVAPSCVKLNHKKGSLSLEEFEKKHGYKPKYKLTEPPKQTTLISSATPHPDWGIFLKDNLRNKSEHTTGHFNPRLM